MLICPKKGARDGDPMEILVGAPTLETVPVTRVKRRPTKSTVALAGVPEAAIKLERCTATVWPGRRTEVSFAPANVVASAGTVKPWVSTPNATPGPRVTVTVEPRGRFVPTRLPELGWKRSFEAIWNWLGKVGTRVTTPSIQSLAEVSSGS